MSRPTLHLVPEPVWAARDPEAPYLPAAYEADGFVHCTDGDDEMVVVANRFYRDDPRPFLLLTLDLERTGSPWRFDDDNGVWRMVDVWETREQADRFMQRVMGMVRPEELPRPDTAAEKPVREGYYELHDLVKN